MATEGPKFTENSHAEIKNELKGILLIFSDLLKLYLDGACIVASIRFVCTLYDRIPMLDINFL